MTIEITLRDGEKIYVDRSMFVTVSCFCMHVGTKIKMIDPNHGGDDITFAIRKLLLDNGIELRTSAGLIKKDQLNQAYEQGKAYGMKLGSMVFDVK
jgi:hypothetical protein